MFTKKTLIISKSNDKFDTKTLEINVQYKIAKKTSYYSINLMLVFEKEPIVCKDSNYALYSVYQNNIDFFTTVRLHYQKKA